MAVKKTKVLGIGSPIVDFLVNVPESFIKFAGGEKGGMELVSSAKLDSILKDAQTGHVKAPGGSAGNTIFGLAKLGMSSAMLGKVGKDEDGDFYKATLASLGGDVKSFRSNDSVHTGRCLCLVTPDSERTMRTDLGAAATIGPDEITLEDFSDISHVHIEGYVLFSEPLARKVLSTAKEAGCTVSLDLASFEVVRFNKGILPELLDNYVDIVFANEAEGKEFTGFDDPGKILEVFSKHCQVCVLKVGEKGSYIKQHGSTVQVGAEKVKAVDTTGAGDLWQAGFLFGFLTGKPLEVCGRYGSILGAEVVKVMGATISEERWTEIKKIVK